MSLTDEDVALIGRMVRESVAELRAGGMPVPMWKLGTVASAVAFPGNGVVLADGDSVALSAINATGVEIPAGARVRLMYDVPHGVWIDGVVGGGAQSIPIGVIWPYDGTSAPDGWLLCDQIAESRTEYPALNDYMSERGYPHGNGDGSTTFNKPDLRGRTWAGLDDLGGTDAGRLSLANTLGTTTGTQTHTLSAGEIPSLTHSVTHDASHMGLGNDIQAGTGYTFIGASISVAAHGSGNAHNNMQPTMLGGWIIKH